MKWTITLITTIVNFMIVPQSFAVSSLEDRYSSGLCLGHWTITESATVKTREDTVSKVKKSRMVRREFKVPMVPTHAPRTRNLGLAWRWLQDMCTDHARRNSEGNEFVMKIDGHHMHSHTKREYSFSGNCTGTYFKYVKEFYDATESGSSETTPKTYSQTVRSTRTGLTKKEILSNMTRYIEKSYRNSKAKVVSTSEARGVTTTRTTTTEFKDPVFVSCSSADHISPGRIDEKVKFLFAKVAEMQKKSSDLCGNIEFKVVQGTLWHIRLRDRQKMALTQADLNRIDELAVKYPNCVLSGDESPEVPLPDEADFAFGDQTGVDSELAEQVGDHVAVEWDQLARDLSQVKSRNYTFDMMHDLLMDITDDYLLFTINRRAGSDQYRFDRKSLDVNYSYSTFNTDKNMIFKLKSEDLRSSIGYLVYALRKITNPESSSQLSNDEVKAMTSALDLLIKINDLSEL